MSTPEVQLYIAASLDGYIATPDGAFDWLDEFNAVDYSYEAFMAGIGTIVMGRKSYEQALGFQPWPYADKQVVVLTTQAAPPGQEPPAVSFYHGDLVHLCAELKKAGTGNIWLFGGGQVVRAFQDADLIDRFLIFVIPILIGDGIRLFPPSSHRSHPRLVRTQPYESGVVLLEYTRVQ